MPLSLSKPIGTGPGLAERLGVDSAAMRSETPLRIMKWVRTEQVATFDDGPKDEKEVSPSVPV